MVLGDEFLERISVPWTERISTKFSMCRGFLVNVYGIGAKAQV